MALKRRRDSPAIDGMRIRHNARPRTGQGASRRAPRRGWRSRATTSGSRFSKTRQKPARKAGRKERGETTTKDGETRTGGEKAKKSERAGHVKYPEPIGMCPLCGPWPGRMQGPIRGGGGRPSPPPPPCGRMSGRHAQGPELVKAGRAERAAGAGQGTWNGGEVERGRAGHRQPLGAAARTEDAAAAALPPATSDSALRLPPPLWPAPPMTSARACAAVESGRPRQRRAFACPQRAAQLRWLGIRAIAAACAP